LFAYPPSTKPPTKEAVEKVATAVLSTTAKAKARAKEKKEKGDAIETVGLIHYSESIDPDLLQGR
jgi:26S proteasome regulatory subunit N2